MHSRLPSAHPLGSGPAPGPPRCSNRERRTDGGGSAARTIAGLLCLLEQVIAPILAAVRSPRLGRKPSHWTTVGRGYETVRIGMQTLFDHLGIACAA
jgi:hypothetical protein